MSSPSARAEVELLRRSAVALRVGQLSLSAGTGSYRVKASMARTARALGIEKHAAHVTLTEITATSHRGSSICTEVAEVRAIGVNAARLAELETTVSRLEAQRANGRTEVTVEEATAELDRIADQPMLYPAVVNASSAGVACAAFAFLNDGGPVEIVAVAVGATLGQAVRRALVHRRYNQFGVTMLAAAVSALVYLGLVDALQASDAVEGRHEAGYVSAVLFLIPGFPLVTGALDLARLDFSAGLTRLTYALMVLMTAALSLGAVSSVLGLNPETLEPPALDAPALWSLRCAASFLGVLGFAVMFNSPWRMALLAATVGMIANVGRLALVDVAVRDHAAAAAAALLVGVLAAYTAPRIHVPRVTVSVPAVIVMVPGTTAYRAVFHMTEGSATLALVNAINAALVVVALSIGLAVARMLTDPTWTFDR